MRTRLNCDRGFSLVELLVALVVLSIGTVAAYRAIGVSTAQVADAPRRLLAAEAALNRVAELQLLGADAVLPLTVQQGPHQITLGVTRAETRAGLTQAVVTARTGGVGARFTTYLAPRMRP